MAYTKIDRTEMTAKLRQKHQATFDALDESKAMFIPKMVHNVKGHKELGKCAGFFESELKELVNVYTEMVDINMDSEDNERRLFRIRPNPHFREEYATSEPNQNGDCRYFIPFDEFEEVKLNKPKLSTRREEIDKLDIPNDPNMDLPMEQMTMRDYAAIHMKEPVSLKSWLNDVIKEANTKPF
jgi:hypothetical protein